MVSENTVWIFFLGVSLLWGFIAGSFATMLIYRLPRGVSLWGKKDEKKVYNRSFCTACDHVLKAKNLIPILSYLIQRGKCAYCGQKIASTYPIAECLSLFLSVSLYAVIGPQWALIPVLLAVPVLVCLLMIDLQFRILPDSLNAALVVLGLAYHGLSHHALLGYILSGIIYAAASFFLAWLVGKVLKKEAMGMGDVKFFAAAGVWLGLPLLSQFLIVAGLTGIVFGTVYKKLTDSTLFPFGPALIISLIICFAL